ncbi:protein kinase [Streptococcus iniae]
MAKITFHDKTIIKNFFNEGGYVLDFSNRTFDEFTYHSIGVKIQEKYGLSKGKSFEAYIDEATDEDLIKLVKDLLTYYDDLPDNSSEKNDIKNKQAEKLKEKINAYTHIGEEIVKADESFLTKGGFADIYLQKHTQRIVKKLKNEYKQDSALKSRFKREFEIMQSLSQVNGIIKVYVFDESEFSYTMEKADFTLNDYIGTNDLEMYQIFNLLFQILTIMSEVHSRDIIHRDLSPTNIFLCNGLIKISDFGLAKDSTANHSHLTVNTNNYGQFYYCAPEQISGLKIQLK